VAGKAVSEPKAPFRRPLGWGIKGGCHGTSRQGSLFINHPWVEAAMTDQLLDSNSRPRSSSVFDGVGRLLVHAGLLAAAFAVLLIIFTLAV
jgi:hypothetical protein